MSFGIWNNIDELALYLGVDRLPKEDDDSFKDRLYRVSRFMFKPDSYNQLQAIAAQCGLDVKPILQIDSDKWFICNIDNEYFTLETEESYLRIFIGQKTTTVQTILDGLAKVQDINFITYSPDINTTLVKYIIKNTNLKVVQEFMYNNSIYLKNKNIQRGSVEFEDNINFVSEKNSLVDIKKTGDYFIDYENGYIESKGISVDGQIVKYKYTEQPFIIETSEVAITPMNTYFKYGFNEDNIEFIKPLLDNNVWAK